MTTAPTLTPPLALDYLRELSDAEKDAISHRGRAARTLLEWLLPTVG